MADKPLGERVSALEADNSSSKADIAEIFRLLRVASEANARTAVQLDELTRRVNVQHAPENCPNTAKVTEMLQAYWAGRGVLWFVGGGGVALGTALGILVKFGGH
jgi:UDP-N-acetylmuramate-alanine ligase